MSTPEELEAQQRRLIDRLLTAEADVRALAARLHVLETWAQDPSQPLAAQGSRLRELELAVQAVDFAAIVQRIRTDPELRELLRGPAGKDGENGKPGAKGADVDSAAVVARIRSDPELRRLLRGPQGLKGEDGRRGQDGDNGATVIREVKIVG